MRNGIKDIALGADVASDLYIVKNTHELEQLQVLERTRHSFSCYLLCGKSGHIFPKQIHIALGRSIHAGTHIEERGLSCSVRTDNPEDISRHDLHIYVVDCFQTAKVFAQAL